MELKRQAQYGNTQGIRLLRQLLSEGRLVFSSTEAKSAASQAGVSQSYLNSLLSSLVRSGWLMRVRPGLFTTSSSLLGGAGVHPFTIATRLVTPSAISHWSALHYHGLTEQVPMIVNAFTPKKVVTPSMRAPSVGRRDTRHAWNVAGIRYEYFKVQHKYFFGIEEVWLDQSQRVPITDRERSALEAFVSPRLFGGMGEALGMLEEHFRELDLDKLVEYAVRCGKASVAKRLGLALERAGAPASMIAPLQEVAIVGFRALDPTRPNRGPCIDRWMIQDNLSS